MSRTGLEYGDGTENRQVIDSAICLIPTIRPTGPALLSSSAGFDGVEEDGGDAGAARVATILRAMWHEG